eukprot:gene8207-34_t
MSLMEGLSFNAPVSLATAGWIYSFFFKEISGRGLITASEKLFSELVNSSFNEAALRSFLANGTLIVVNKTSIVSLKRSIKWFKEINNVYMQDAGEVFRHLALDFMGISNYSPVFQIPKFEEFKAISGLILCEKAFKMLEEGTEIIETQAGLVSYYELKLYHCLLLIRFFKIRKNDSLLEKIKHYLAEYELFSKIGPEYLAPRYQLLKTNYESSTMNHQDK